MCHCTLVTANKNMTIIIIIAIINHLQLHTLIHKLGLKHGVIKDTLSIRRLHPHPPPPSHKNYINSIKSHISKFA